MYFSCFIYSCQYCLHLCLQATLSHHLITGVAWFKYFHEYCQFHPPPPPLLGCPGWVPAWESPLASDRPLSLLGRGLMTPDNSLKLLLQPAFSLSQLVLSGWAFLCPVILGHHRSCSLLLFSWASLAPPLPISSFCPHPVLSRPLPTVLLGPLLPFLPSAVLPLSPCPHSLGSF